VGFICLERGNAAPPAPRYLLKTENAKFEIITRPSELWGGEELYDKDLSNVFDCSQPGSEALLAAHSSGLTGMVSTTLPRLVGG